VSSRRPWRHWSCEHQIRILLSLQASNGRDVTGSNNPTLNYDVFLSTAPEDVDFAAAVARSLGDRGLRVRFEEVREGSLGPGRAVASGAIGASTVFLAIYSHAYARRRDCQSELALALIASADSADPMRHIMVLNPEPESNHILPPQLMNALAEANPEAADREEIATLANEVEARALKVLSPLGRPSLIAPPPFHGLPDLPERAFVGRADLLWAVHGALWEQATHDDAVHEPKVVVLHGDSGMGKTSVAIEYARRFGAAYPGGVFWLRGYGEAHAHGGMLQEDRDAERDRQIREIAADLGVIISNRSPTEIRFALDEALERRRLACLWVVDGLPPGLSENEVRRWIGSVAVAKTVVTTFSEDYLDVGSALAVEPLGVDDGFALLTAQRHPVGIVEETAAARGAVQDLG